MESSDQEFKESFLLSREMPYPAVNSLLGYLDTCALETLRLVCQSTKSWIENVESLGHFVVRITGKPRLDEVLRSSVPWNSFVFTKKYTSISEADVQRFLATYGDLVRHLEFKWRRENLWSQLQLRLLSDCPYLESLRCIHLNFYLISNLLANQLLENWKNLRHFHVEVFTGSRNMESGPMSFFSRLLLTCTQLKTLTIPRFHLNLVPEDFQQLVFTPLLDTVALGRLRNVGGIFSRLNAHQRLRLLLACAESRTVLRGVDLTPRDLSPEHLSALDIISDLHTISDAVIRLPLTNVRTIYFNCAAFRTFEDRGYIMPPFPRLTSVHLNFRFRDPESAEHRKGLEALDLFAHRLAQMKRPSVKLLHVEYCHLPGVSAVALCASLLNLRALHLIGWMGQEKEWLKLWSLVGNTLAKLELRHCANLSDRVILGDNLSQPAFLQLKYLRKLKYERYLTQWQPYNPGRGRVTERSFIHAFSHMRLRSFVFFEGTSLDEYSPISSETTQAMWKGAFA